MAAILCITDDRNLVDQLRRAFGRAGDEVLTAPTRMAALRTAQELRPHLVILDLDTPAVAGRQLLSSLHQRTPVVVLSATAREEDVLAALAAGADDYVKKPFSPSMLVGRVKAVLRRIELVSRDTQRQDKQEAIYRIGSAVFEPALHRIVDGAACVALTPTQSHILQLLCAHEGQAVSTERIVSHLRGWGDPPDKGVIRTHIRYLREKVARLPDDPQVIQTVQGIGYRVRQDAGRTEGINQHTANSVAKIARS